ncbi:hypothetical protein Adt_32910 [Abeliophyllum distichum]|uniref:Uncharacterized protein n=1 Tax=Abeliophyllum distichum TaxID=126358 RepID=A0ABD1QUR1_9LAMI
MVVEDLKLLREAYRIPSHIELMLLGPNELACAPRRGMHCLALECFRERYAFASASILSKGIVGLLAWLQPMWPQMDGARWLGADTCGSDTHLVRKCPCTSSRLFIRRGSCRGRKAGKRSLDGNWQMVVDDLQPDLDIPNVYGIANALPRCELSSENEENIPLTKKRKVRISGVGTSSQPKEKAVEVVDNYVVCGAPSLQRILSVNPSGEVVLQSPPLVTQNPGGPTEGPYDSKKKLIGASGLRMPDDPCWNLPFYPSMGAQAVKKYFTPKWKEFSSHGALEECVGGWPGCGNQGLGDAAEGAGPWKGLQVTVDSMRTAYEQLQVDLKEFESNVLNLTKQLDNANAAQRVAAEALEATNKEKKRLLDESKSHEQEAQSLRESLEATEKGRKETEAEVT